MNPFISIIVPTYNRANLIGDTILSLINQNYNNYEIIVVDDGSIDNTAEVIAGFNDPKIKYFKKINEERGMARNYGVTHSKGEYVNFFDSDDIAFQDHLLTAAATINNLKMPEIFSLGYNIICNGKLEKEVSPEGQLNYRIQRKNIISPNAVFIRKDIAVKYPFSSNRDIAISEDLLLWLQLSARYIIYAIPIITCSLIQHDNRSMVTDQPEKTLLRMKLLLDELKTDEIYMNKYGKRYLPFVKTEKMLSASLTYAQTKRKSKALGLLIKSLAITPSQLFNRRFLAISKYLLVRW